jgi:hypothetical protein
LKKKQETSKDDQQNEKASSKQAPSDKEVKKEKDA